MHVAIIGAGFTGLTAAFELQKKGHFVSMFEKEQIPGGLAMGFQNDAWEWSLEKHYHHIFTSDDDILKLTLEIEVQFRFSRPNTSSYIDGDILQLDSPIKLLLFEKLTVGERIRMAAVLGYLRYFARWQSLEQYTAHAWLQKYLGVRAYKMLWEPLLRGKFGPYYKDISLSWFWARIKARTTQLGYPDGGFQHLAHTLAGKIIENGGSIRYGSEVTQIKENHLIVDGTVTEADAILVTLPNKLFMKHAPSLPDEYVDKLQSFKGIGAVNMVLELDAPFLPHNVYWLNICDESFPFLAVVEHTNYVNKSHYNDSHIVYVGNYLPQDHQYFSLSDEELLNTYDSALEKISLGYRAHILSKTVFRVPFAQPIVTQDFSKHILPFQTPLKNVYLANMQQVYPWDRGTNFAVEIGKRVADYIDTTYEKKA